MKTNVIRRDICEDISSVLYTEEDIVDRIEGLADEIDAAYSDVDDLLLICVLKGSYVFMSDLSRALTRKHEVDFMAVSSYGASTRSSGVVQIRMDLKDNIAGQHVLIVEDIIDSGRTLNYLRELLYGRDPASIKICTLLDKPSRREVDVPVDFIGFEIPDKFVVGYGLDFGEIYRNLPYIGVLKSEIFTPIIEAQAEVA